MDVFGLHERLIDDYARFTRSFVDIADKRIADTVAQALDERMLWPDPWVQLNPSFEPGGTPDDLVAEGLLHRECARIFRAKHARDDFGEPITLYRHQTEAIRAARGGANYVLTTGTGSGKSLSYLVPIVDHVLRAGPGGGIRALVVYPDERPGQQPVRRAREVLALRLWRGAGAGELRPLHRTRVR